MWRTWQQCTGQEAREQRVFFPVDRERGVHAATRLPVDIALDVAAAKQTLKLLHHDVPLTRQFSLPRLHFDIMFFQVFCLNVHYLRNVCLFFPFQVNNGYLVRDLDPLAVVYNDASVLENFHAAEGFKMMLEPAFDILRVWGRTFWRRARRNRNS